MSEPRLSIDIWSDVVCPWCFVGKRRLEAALAGFAHRDRVDVRWHAFELDPSAPRLVEGTHVDRLARKYGITTGAAKEMLDRMTRTGAQEGVSFDFDHARSGNSFDAHRLLDFAHQHGRQDALKERLFRAYFSEGAAIGDRETLVQLAGEAGLDKEQARAVLFSDAHAGAVRADEAKAASLGIHGVPFFVLDGKHALSGAQPAEVLRRALEQAFTDRESASRSSPES